MQDASGSGTILETESGAQVPQGTKQEREGWSKLSGPDRGRGPAALIITTMQLGARPGKRREMLQVLAALVRPTRECKGCMGCHVYEDPEQPDCLGLVAEWATRKDLEIYWRSDTGGILIGAIQTLCESPSITLSIVSSQEQVDVAAFGIDQVE